MGGPTRDREAADVLARMAHGGSAESGVAVLRPLILPKTSAPSFGIKRSLTRTTDAVERLELCGVFHCQRDLH